MRRPMRNDLADAVALVIYVWVLIAGALSVLHAVWDALKHVASLVIMGARL